MSTEVWILFAAVLPATITGLATYFTTKHKIQEGKEDKAGALFDDSRQLTNDYKAAYKEATDDLHGLKAEISELRNEVGKLIKEGEMWRNVAVAAYLDQEDTDPHWWPDNEPRPGE